MRRIVFAQLRVQRPLVGLIAIGVAVLSTVLTITLEGSATLEGPPGAGATGVSDLAAADGLAHALRQGASLLGAVALAYVAASFAQDFSLGTIRNLLLREPRRGYLITGKLLAHGLTIAGTVVVAAFAAVGGAYLAAAVKGIDTAAWFSAAGFEETLGTVGGLILGTVGWGLIGAALGILFRSTAISLGFGLAYALPVESLLGALWDDGASWLPGKLLNALPGGGDVDFAHALVVASIYVGVLLVVSVTSFVRRDVTA